MRPLLPPNGPESGRAGPRLVEALASRHARTVSSALPKPGVMLAFARGRLVRRSAGSGSITASQLTEGWRTYRVLAR